MLRILVSVLFKAARCDTLKDTGLKDDEVALRTVAGESKSFVRHDIMKKDPPIVEQIGDLSPPTSGDDVTRSKECKRMR